MVARSGNASLEKDSRWKNEKLTPLIKSRAEDEIVYSTCPGITCAQTVTSPCSIGMADDFTMPVPRIHTTPDRGIFWAVMALLQELSRGASSYVLMTLRASSIA